MAALGWLLNLGFGGSGAAGGATVVPVFALYGSGESLVATRNQSLTVNFLAWDTSANAGKTGDSANFTLRLVKDGGAATAPANSISEPDATNMPGVYEIELTSTEMNASFLALHGISSTGNVSIMPVFLTTTTDDLRVNTSGASTEASSYTLTTGTQSANSYTSTALDTPLFRHQHTDTAGVMELYYEFNVGSGIPSSVLIKGFIESSSNTIDIYGRDWVTSTWKIIGTMNGRDDSNDETFILNIHEDMVGTGGDDGKVRIRFFRSGGLSSATLHINHILVSYILGHDNLATSASLATAQADLDTLTGSDGVTLATSQPNYAPNTTTPPTAASIADAVLDEALSGHTTAGSLGKAVADIETDTNELQTDDYPTTLATLATASALTTVDTVVDAIKAKTDNLTFTVANQVDANTLSIGGTTQTANDNGADINAILADTNELQTDWANGGRLDLLVDSIISLLDDARGEPGQGNPPVNPDTVTKIDYLYKAWRNKATQTATTYSLYDDAGTTVDHKATVSDNGTTATKGEIVTGP